MCWSCNPYCGNCKPPKERPRKCSVCNKFNFNLEASVCEACGATLPPRVAPETVLCLYIDKLCANPCGKAKLAPAKGPLEKCAFHTPPKDQNTPDNNVSAHAS